jgi:hypothetical protein
VTGGEPSCTVAGDNIQVSGGISSENRTISVPAEENYYIKACGTNGYGIAQSEPKFADSYPTPTAPTGDLTYTVGNTPVTTHGTVRDYVLKKSPKPTPKNKYDVVYKRGGETSTEFGSLLRLESAPGISVAYCRDRFIVGYTCDPSSDVNATGAPTIVRVEFPTACRPAKKARETNPGWVSQAARNSVTITADVSDDRLTVTYTVTFTGAFRSLQPAVSDPICVTPDPVPPKPTPTPTPTPTKTSAPTIP